MSSRRLISSDLFEDEFIGGLEIFHRYLWVGLISACADDQGRFLANPAVIRARLFPFDDYKIEKIEESLQIFAKAGKLIIYEINGKRLAQIAAWWKHQAPSWASPSKYPPPPSWLDRIKYHAVGNKVIAHNWDKSGGLPSVLPSALPTYLPSAINESESESESEGESKGAIATYPPMQAEEPKQPPPPTSPTMSIPNILARASGMSSVPPKESERLEQIRSLIDVHGAERVEAALKDACTKWTSTRAKSGSYYRIINMGWVDWAQEALDNGGGSVFRVTNRSQWDALPYEDRAAWIQAGKEIPR